MKQPLQTSELGGRQIAAYFPTNADGPVPVTYILSGPDPALDLSATLKILDNGFSSPFAAVAIGSTAWNIDYSPWPAPPVLTHDSPFGGSARQMISWVTDHVLPWAEQQLPEGRAARRCIMGYSLAGLASLYAMYVTDTFDACGCCSGSLWFDGWRDYIRDHRVHPDSKIYLSLGRGEEKTRNPRMAVVGDVTCEAAEIYSSDPHVAAAALVWHDGGHFTKIPERTAAALTWLLR